MKISLQFSVSIILQSQKRWNSSTVDPTTFMTIKARFDLRAQYNRIKMPAFRIRCSILVQIFAIIALLKAFPVQAGEEMISSQLKDTLNKKGVANVLVTFKTRPKDTIQKMAAKMKSISDRGQRIKTLSNALEQLALSSQKQAVELLKSQNSDITFRILWITNQLSIRGTSLVLLKALAKLSDVAQIKETQVFEVQKQNKTEVGEESKLKSKAYNGDKIDDMFLPSWSVNRIHAPEVWELGYDGSGVVIGTIDTGVQVTLDTIQDSYVGTKNYGWFDPGNLTKIPSDMQRYGWGTAPMVVAVGNLGLGVAPGANWMACRGSNGYYYQEDWILTCFQFMTCPTDYQGNNKDCSKAPHIIMNTWYYSPSEDDSAMTEIIPLFANLDITLVFSIGDDLSEDGNCASSTAPGNYAEFIGVGMTDDKDQVNILSAAGPSPAGVIKPDLVAPSYGVLTADRSHNSFYRTSLGTTFAAPVVAGVVALMLQKNPTLSKEEIRSILIKSADPAKTILSACGGVPNTEIPNNRGGYGVVNALKAINAVPSL